MINRIEQRLQSDMTGMQARANSTVETVSGICKNANWYEILLRTCKANFKSCTAPPFAMGSSSLRFCKEANDTITKLEAEWMMRAWWYKADTASPMLRQLFLEWLEAHPETPAPEFIYHFRNTLSKSFEMFTSPGNL